MYFIESDPNITFYRNFSHKKYYQNNYNSSYNYGSKRQMLSYPVFIHIRIHPLFLWKLYYLCTIHILFVFNISIYSHSTVYHGSSCFPIKTALTDIGNTLGNAMFFMIFTGLTAPLSYAYRMIFGWCSLGFKESPSHSQWISFRVTWRSSSGVSGQWKALRSSRFIRIQNPDPSHWRIFIEVRRRLQNANMQREYGSRWNFNLMMAARPL